jgi:two-component system sensor histidine kinase KdpD
VRFVGKWLTVLGIAASVGATAAYNYFFIPPLHTFRIDDPRNFMALAVFLVWSLIVTRLVVAAREQAADAERRRLEGEASAHIDLLRQSDAFKTSLLRAVSHDLTTPLTAIRIHTQSLKRHAAAAPELANVVNAIDDETARLEAGRFTPHPEPTPPADIFHSVRESLPLVFASRPVTISVERDCPDAYVDPSLVLEIVVNLVENAHRAAPAGAALELTAKCVEGRVLLEVLDRGPGIAADADVAQRGLGLEIARGLTAASNGTFTLVNRAGGGALARVELPAAVMPDVEETE